MPRPAATIDASGTVHRDLDFAGRSLYFASYRDAARGNRIVLAVTIGNTGTVVRGSSADEVFGKLVTALDAVERIPAVARVALRADCALALHGDPVPPMPEPFTTLTMRGGRPCLTTLTAGPTLTAWAGRSR